MYKNGMQTLVYYIKVKYVTHQTNTPTSCTVTESKYCMLTVEHILLILAIKHKKNIVFPSKLDQINSKNKTSLCSCN